MIRPVTRPLTRAELAAIGVEDGRIVQSNNRRNLVAALRNVHAPSIAAAIVEAKGLVAARQIARELNRIAGGME